jgi:predicted PurR-regulated permease PerM
MLRFIGILLLIGGLFYLSNIVLVILTSIVIASFVTTGSRRLTRFKLNRTLSVVLIYLVSIVFLASVFYLVIPLFLNELSTLFTLISKYLPLSSSQSETVVGASHAFSNWSSVSFTEFVSRIQNIAATSSSDFFSTAFIAFGGLLNLLLIVVISFYLSIEEHGVENFLRIVLPLKREQYVIDLWKRTERKLALWVRGQLVLGLIIGVLIYLGLAITGMKYALIMALLAALFELIPFGLILAAVPAVLFAYIDGGVTLALIVLGFYFIVHQFEVYLIQPVVIKKVVGVSPLIVIISLLIGAQLAGFWGVILAVPVAVVVLELFDDLIKKKVFIRQGNEY